jgi:3'-phosphoadenosine 5'-phosphosulfate sulfotransferase (PAPS reductase)/FAD synthetase
MNEALIAAFARHQRIGFQFSGGRDSTVALYHLRDYWSRMVVYHLDTGDQFPELRKVVDLVAQDVPIVVIESSSPAVRRAYGLPSDLVPVDNLDVGRAMSGRATKIQSRFECCARSLMIPMHQRMLDDGVTLIVRGTRDDEFHEPVTRTGDTDGRVELLFPIHDWSAEQVDLYIEQHLLPVGPFYEAGMPESPECMGCTAWWGDGRAKYLRENHPQAFAKFREGTRLIRIEIDRQYAQLDDKE